MHIVQGIRVEIWPNLRQIGIKLDLVLFEAQNYVEHHVKTPPEKTLGKILYGQLSKDAYFRNFHRYGGEGKNTLPL